MVDAEVRRAKQREYFRTHPEARAKRDAYTKKWMKENRERWNEYQKQYQYKKRMAKAVADLEKENNNG